jgi:hypothetical protein
MPPSRGPAAPGHASIRRHPMRRGHPMCCTAVSKQTGQPCGQPAKIGMSVCHYHGGASPNAIEAAAERIRRLAEGPALDRMERLIDSEQDSVALATARDLLDRAGYGVKQAGTTTAVDITVQVEYVNRPAPTTADPA